MFFNALSAEVRHHSVGAAGPSGPVAGASLAAQVPIAARTAAAATTAVSGMSGELARSGSPARAVSAVARMASESWRAWFHNDRRAGPPPSSAATAPTRDSAAQHHREPERVPPRAAAHRAGAGGRERPALPPPLLCLDRHIGAEVEVVRVLVVRVQVGLVPGVVRFGSTPTVTRAANDSRRAARRRAGSGRRLAPAVSPTSSARS